MDFVLAAASWPFTCAVLFGVGAARPLSSCPAFGPFGLYWPPPVLRGCGVTLARLIPMDESSAEPLAKLVGQVATIINGTAQLSGAGTGEK